MKAEIRTVYFERLPAISLKINVEPLECLSRFEAIIKGDKRFAVRGIFDGDGNTHCNQVAFSDKAEKKHEGLIARFVHWNMDGRKLRLQMDAHRWNPDPATYDCYVVAAKRLFQPFIDAYNRQFKICHRMQIETRGDLLPKMTPKVQETFSCFVVNCNKSSLHPNDWENYYRFVRASFRYGRYFYEDEMRWFCRQSGFDKAQAEALAVVYFHCYHFCKAFRRRW
jgi:hypothetical protein